MSAISRRSFATAIACAPALAVTPVAAQHGALGERFNVLLPEIVALRVAMEAAFDRLNEAEEARFAAEIANPYPTITERDEVIFNYVVRADHPAGWNSDRFDWVRRPDAFFSTAQQAPAERERHAARLVRMDELEPQVRAVDEVLFPLLEVEADAQATVDALLLREERLLREARGIAARSLKDLVAKACILGVAVGSMLDSQSDPAEELAYSIARDLIAIGEASYV